jgi:hypothetical protein
LKNKEHLTSEGFNKIIEIKVGMNKGFNIKWLIQLKVKIYLFAW